MPGLLDFFRCVGKAVVSRGPRALLGLIPFGEAIFDIATEAAGQLRQQPDEQVRQQLTAVAEADTPAARQAAEVVAGEVAANEPQLQSGLVSYLSLVPDAVRQSLRRPADPTGKTVPPALSVQKAEQLLPLLPTRLPRFHPGDRPTPGGNWELVELLGVGGFGEVWKARHPQLKSVQAALKFCLDPRAVELLRHEGALLDRLLQHGSHPGIVPLRQAVLDADPCYLEYEYIDGGDLTRMILRPFESPPERVRWATSFIRHLAGIVGTFHRLDPPIVHRDLKPANILLQRVKTSTTAGLRPRIADFGIGGLAASRALAQTEGGKPRGELLVTTMRGSHTPLYASPQQARGEAPDARDDVHALGVIWYQFLVGEVGQGVGPDFIVELRERGVDDATVALLGRCVSAKAERRPRDAAEMAEEIGKLVLPGSSSTVVPTQTAAPEVIPVANTTRTSGEEFLSVTRMEVTVPGVWYSRPEDRPEAEWQKEAETPSVVAVLQGRVYQLDVRDTAADADLAGLERLSGVAALHNLVLGKCRAVTDAGLGHLGSLSRLQALVLDDCRQLTSGGLVHLGGLEALRALSLCRCRKVTDAGFGFVAMLPGLHHLIFDDCGELTDAGVAHLPRLSGLRALYLCRCAGVTDVGATHLSRFAALECLELWGCEQLSDAGVGHLARLGGLRSLKLDGPRVTDQAIARLAPLASLETLWVEWGKLTDAGLASLKGLPALREAGLFGCKKVTDAGLAHLGELTTLRKLRLGSERVSDAGYAQVGKLTGLEGLELFDCKRLTDASLGHLHGLTSLRELSLTGCERVTDVGRRKLREALPDCKISIKRT